MKTTTTKAAPTVESVLALIERNAIEAEKRNAEEAKRRAERDAEEAKRREERDAEEAKRKAERDAEEAKRREEEAKRSAELDAKFDKLNKDLIHLKETVGGIGNNNGYAAEDYFYNALKENPVFGNIRYDRVRRNEFTSSGRMQDEFDLILVNGKYVAVIETKHRVQPDALKKLVERKAPNFRALYPEFANHKLYLGLAGMSFDARVLEDAIKQGVGVLKQKGETIEEFTDKMKEF